MLEQKNKYRNILDYVAIHANSDISQKKAFIFINSDNGQEESITFKNLDKKIKSISSSLLLQIKPGEKVILCYPPGLDYILAFYACLYSGIVAVPVYPPQGKSTISRFIKVMDNCQAKFILSNFVLKEKFLSKQSTVADFSENQLIFTDKITDTDNYNSPNIDGESLAFLQYTSGSTGDPKGVMISHNNIIANLKSLQEATTCNVDDVFVNWLPLFHDLGLVNTMLLPVYLGASSILMSPLSFVSTPKIWFDAITKYKGSICGGPNFCFELCLKKIKPEDLSNVDLRSWRIAFNAAEPIYEKTIELFSENFSSIGFNKTSFYPSYGMAEATVYLTGRKYDASLASTCGNEGKNIVACGNTTSFHELRIVDPKTKISLSQGNIGEIWVSGPSIAMGYLNKQDLSEEIFRAKILNEEKGTNWLRTGDLGFIKNNELYVTGRIKEVVIIRGQNYYPTDIERTAQESHIALKVGGGAAFSVEIDDEERLVIVQEVDRVALRQLNPEEIYDAVLASIGQEYQLDVHTIILIKPGQLEKTTSGKIQRQLCKHKFLNSNIEMIHQFDKGTTNTHSVYVSPITENEKIIANALEEEFHLKKISLHENFFSLGINSISLTRAILNINKILNIDLSISSIFENPSINKLAKYIEDIDRRIDIKPTSIPKANKNLFIPLSFAQQRLWFLWKLEGANPFYNESHSFKLKGELDYEALHEAFNAILHRHEILKTRIIEQDGKAIQVFDENIHLNIKIEIVENESDILRILKEEALYSFELDKDNLVRVKVLKSTEYYVLIITLHHIVTDGWSLEILSHELNELYTAHKKKRTSSLSELPVQYADYAYWQREHLRDEIIEKELKYWRTKLKDLPILHNLPLDKKRPVEQTLVGKQYQHIISKNTVEKIKKLCEEKNTTLFIFLQSALAILLSRYSGEVDIVIGSPIAGRTHKDIEKLIGFFVNTLIIRHDLSSCKNFNDLLKNCKKSALEAYANQSIPFETLVNELQPQRNVAYNPLVQIALVLQENYEHSLKLSEISVEKIYPDFEEIFVKYDLEISATECNKELSLIWKYNTDLFFPSTIERLASYFEVLLESILKYPENELKNLDILTLSDKKKLLKDWVNDDSYDEPNYYLHELFETQVLKNSDHIAVIYENEKISYCEINKRANQLAHYLIEQSVKPNFLVALFIERSIEMIVAILGVLKAGGTYVPIDPSNPKQRIENILSDSSVKLILTQCDLKSLLPQNGVALILLDDKSFIKLLREYPTNNIQKNDGLSPSNLAYVIYTSGSTGKPKGVMVSHKNATRLFFSSEKIYDFNSLDVWTLFHSYAFDFSVWEIWGALLYGGKLLVVPYWVCRDAEKFIDLLKQHHVTVLNQTPSSFYQLLAVDKHINEKYLSSLRYIIFGGEILDYKALAPWYENYGSSQTQLVNMYGITETTVHVTYHFLKPEDPFLTEGSVIGQALPDLQVYVLDDDLQLLPIGVRGELYVSGAGVALGYLNNPLLTSERFIQNPFNINANSRLYKTGDIGRFLSNGKLEYIGRIDDQVKIRGFRIELSEIEIALSQHKEVSACTVLARDIADHKQLVAYVIPNNSSHEIELDNILREHLAGLLPHYMLPSIFVFMQEFPLTNNNKLDKKALFNQAINMQTSNIFAAPQTEMEKNISNIWQNLLRLENVGVDDNFFTLGGDSIIAIQLVSQSRQKGFYYGVRDLFKYQTIRLLLPHITTEHKGIRAPQSAVSGELKLLPIQKAFFARQLPEVNHYNQSLLLNVPSGFNFENLRSIISALYFRHDALRLRFYSRNEMYYAQHIPFNENMVNETIVHEFFSSINREDRKNAQHLFCQRLETTINIDNGPLFKAVLFDSNCEQSQLFLTFHHLIIDGVSWRVLLSDIDSSWKQICLSEKIRLPEKTFSLKEWGEMLHKYASSEELQKEKEYWCNQLSLYQKVNFEKKLTIEASLHKIQKATVTVNQKTTSYLLSDCNSTYRTKINDLLLAALFRAYYLCTNNLSLRIDLEGHGREPLFQELDVTETVGWFTSIYPLIINHGSINDIGSLIKKVKELCRAVPNNGIGYGVLKDIKEDSDINHYHQNISLNILFNYLGQIDNSLNNDLSFHQANEQIELSANHKNISEYSLEINSMVVMDQLIINLSSGKNNLYDVSEFATQLEESINICVAHCKEAIGSSTPSDFPLIDIDQEKFDQIILSHKNKNYGKILDIYPLSTTQEEILFQGLFSPSSVAYFEQIHFKFKNGFCEKKWQQAWQYVFECYEILRTGFDHLSLEHPVQIVFDKIELPWIKNDLRGISTDEQENFIKTESEKQRKHGFDFSIAPLVQLRLYQLDNTNYEFVWNFHHILLDGWSMASVISEVLNAYILLANEKQPHPKPNRAYRDYIDWTIRVDNEESKKFWHTYLIGFSEPLKLKIESQDQPASDENFKNNKIEKYLSTSVFDTVNKAIREHNITLNTIFHAALAIALQYYTGEMDIVFGETTSGRPAELDDVENIVGLFIHTIPVRYDMTLDMDILSWLKTITLMNIERTQHSHLSLAEINKLSSVRNQPLFRCLLNVENYPIQESIITQSGILEKNDINHFAQNSFPFTLVIIPDKKIKTYISYDCEQYSENSIVQFLDNIHFIVEIILLNPKLQLNKIFSYIEKHNIDLAKTHMDALKQNRVIRKSKRTIVEIN